MTTRCKSCPCEPGVACIAGRPGWSFWCARAAGGEPTDLLHIANRSLLAAGEPAPPPASAPAGLASTDAGHADPAEAARVVDRAEACPHRRPRPGCGCSGARCVKYDKDVTLVACVRCVRDGRND